MRRASKWAALLAMGLLSLGCKKKTEEAAPASSASAQSAMPTPVALEKQVSQALGHLPADCDVAFSVDAGRLFASKSLGPKLQQSLSADGSPGASQDPGRKAFGDFLRETKVDPPKDLRSVVGCFMRPDPPNATAEQAFVLVLGGDFPPQLAQTMARHAPNQDEYKLVSLLGKKAMTKDGKWLLQAADNAVLFGNNEALLRAALVSGEAHKKYAFEGDKDAGLVLSQKALATLLEPGAIQAKGLSQVTELRLFAQLDSHVLEALLSFPDDKTRATAQAELETQLKTLGAELQRAPAMLRGLMGGLVGVAQGAAFAAAGAQLRITVNIPPAVLAPMIQQLAMMNGGGMPPGGMPPGGMPPGMLGQPGATGVGSAMRSPLGGGLPPMPRLQLKPPGLPQVSPRPSPAPPQTK